MRLKENDMVMYEEVATIEKNDKLKIPHLEIRMKKVKIVVFDGIQFLDEDDNLNHNYRVRYIFRDGNKIENCCYDPIRIAEDTEKIIKENEIINNETIGSIS